MFKNGVKIEDTEMVISLRRRMVIEEKYRPLTESEVSRLLIAQQINTLTVDDNTALRMTEFYPSFADMVGKTVDTIGFKVQHNGKLWATVQQYTTFQAQYEPGAVGTESIFTEICESHAGTLEDPIPYNGNMALKSGKYYMQDGKVYRCIRDTGNPVYNALSELVGLYVKEA